jgi:hypothetical protein
MDAYGNELPVGFYLFSLLHSTLAQLTCNALTLPAMRYMTLREFMKTPSHNFKDNNMKTLGNTTVNAAKKNVSDLVIYGNGDTFKLICKASSQKEGWMKSTKAMEIPGVGCVIQVTTQQAALVGHMRRPTQEINYAVAEALTFVPGVQIELIDGDKKNGRRLVPIPVRTVSNDLVDIPEICAKANFEN